MREGTLREDLFYRLNVVTLHLPPLRERKEDIPILAAQFIAKFAQELGKRVRDLDPAAARLLREYPWPGNVRELQNIIERAVLITDGPLIRPEHLPEGLKTGGTFTGQSLEEGLSIEAYTKAFIRRYQGTLTEQQLADRLGITRKALWEKRKRWDLTR